MNKIVPLHSRPLLPQIEAAHDKGDTRLEELLRRLWQTLFDVYGSVQEADKITRYIEDISDSKGFLTIRWRDRDAMTELRPAVRYAWGVLDVAVWGCCVQIAHYYPSESASPCFIDEYSEGDIIMFGDMRQNDER